MFEVIVRGNSVGRFCPRKMLFVQLDLSPLIARLQAARHVVLVGAGGGFDVLGAVPLWVCLRRAGVAVSLANVSFSDLRSLQERPLHPVVVEVRADSQGPSHYFPERTLSRWFETRGEHVPVYALEKTGVVPLTQAFRALVEKLDADAFVLVDGGTDILMRGDEAGLGTPAEDITSLLAGEALELANKLVVCIGFGVDHFHGVCHAQFLENVAALQRAGGFLGMLSLLPQMPGAQAYLEAVAYTQKLTPARPSIVHGSIGAAVEGAYGDIHRTSRTRGTQLWINPLMSTYFGFDLNAVASRLLYAELLRPTQTIFEVAARLEAFRKQRERKPWMPIPV